MSLGGHVTLLIITKPLPSTVERIAQLADGGPVLEFGIGIGIGRLVLPLLEQGLF